MKNLYKTLGILISRTYVPQKKLLFIPQNYTIDLQLLLLILLLNSSYTILLLRNTIGIDLKRITI